MGMNRIVKNASWIIVCKAIQSVIMLIVGMITARYLGPTNYGVVTYASSIVAFVLPIMQLGLSSTLVQELIVSPDREGEIMGTSLVLSMASALLSIAGVVLFSFLSNPGEPITVVVCFLYSCSLLFQASEMLQYWFQAKLLSKYTSIASLVAYTVTSVYKIALLIFQKDIRWFAVTHVIEAAIISVLLFVIYHRLSTQRLSFSFSLGIEMLSRSKHYIIAGIMVSIFQQTDRIMLKMYQGGTETGFYSSAITCIGITAFVFSAIIESARTSILESKKNCQADFEHKMVGLFSLITYISLAQSVTMTLLAKPIIFVLFGKSYLPAVPVLQIAVWFSTFGYYGVVRNIWILGEQKQKYLWIINLTGALTNVFMNYILIPIWGAIGAAVASLITQIVSNVILCFVIKEFRPLGMIMLRSLHPKALLELLKSLRQDKM